MNFTSMNPAMGIGMGMNMNMGMSLGGMNVGNMNGGVQVGLQVRDQSDFTSGWEIVKEQVNRSRSKAYGVDVCGDIRIERLVGGGASGVVGLAKINITDEHQRHYSRVTQDLQVTSVICELCNNKGFIGGVKEKVVFKTLSIDSHYDWSKGFAVKVVRKNGEARVVDQGIAESRVMMHLHAPHPFLVRSLFAVETPTRFIIAMEYYPGGDLFTLLSDDNSLPIQTTRSYAAQIALALDHLHKHNVLYNDMKPENIAIAADGSLRLLDFGSSVILDNNSKVITVAGTLAYTAPEIMNRQPHGLETDWWGFGVLCYEILFRCVPWYSDDDDELCQFVQTEPLVPPPDVQIDQSSLIGMQLCQQLLAKQPFQRLGYNMGFVEISTHPFFAGMNFQALLAGLTQFS